MFDTLERYFNSLKHNGLARGYYLKPTKSIIIVYPKNLKAWGPFGAIHGFRLCIDACFIGGYIGDNEYKFGWLKKQTDKWEINICEVAKTEKKYPQESYAAVVNQSGYFAIRDKIYGTGIQGIGKNLRKTFLPHIFFWRPTILPPIVGYLSMLLKKKAGLGL